jgi:hypothetical protein
MNDFYNIILPSAGIVFLLMITSFYYWWRGKNEGIMEAVAVFNEFEPDAVDRVGKKLKEKFNVELE